MADLLKSGLAWLTSQLTAHASEIVTYARGYDSTEVHATLGRKLLKLSDEFGIRIEWTDMDFLIPTVDLAFDGEPFTPLRGDQLFVTIDETTVEQFEVFPFGDEPAWRWADPHHSIVRIHAKHIGSEPYV